MKNRSVDPRPWWQVGLTVLPGLTFLLVPVSSLSEPLNSMVRFILLAVLMLVVILSVLVAAKRRSLFQVPVWGLIPLGWVVGFLATWGLFLTTGTLDAYPTCLVLLVVTGLLAAKHNGLSASLFVLAGGMVTTTWTFEAGMFFSDRLVREILFGVGMIVLFTVFTPIWVLRSHSILGQTAGLLFPMVAYSVALVYALSSGSGLAFPMFQFSIDQAVSVAKPFITLFTTTAVAAAVYAWISLRKERRS